MPFYAAFHHLKKCRKSSEAYLGPSRISKMELFCFYIFSKFNEQLITKHPRGFVSKLHYSLAELIFGFHRTIPENNLGILLIQHHLDQNEIPKMRKKCSILDDFTMTTNYCLSSMV